MEETRRAPQSQKAGKAARSRKSSAEMSAPSFLWRRSRQADDSWRGSFLVTSARLAALFLLAVLVSSSSAGVTPDETGVQLFRERIQPVLEANCFECHSASATKIKGGLRLDSREASRRGGETGPAVVPGDSRKSLLIQAIRHEGDLQMPPKKPKLSDEVIADFVKWVELGAPDPREVEPTIPLPYDFKRARELWAFQPV